MGTAARIGILQSSGKVLSIHCSWDGHIETVGRILQTFYKTDEMISELISGGNIEYLGTTLNPPPKGGTAVEWDIQYTERSNDDVYETDAILHENDPECWDVDWGAEFEYLWDPNTSAWYVRDLCEEEEWKILDIDDRPF